MLSSILMAVGYAEYPYTKKQLYLLIHSFHVSPLPICAITYNEGSCKFFVGVMHLLLVSVCELLNILKFTLFSPFKFLYMIIMRTLVRYLQKCFVL